MSGLLGTLGLDQVEADPNALPDGKWAGVIFKSEYVDVKKTDSLAHVITYKVTEGEKNGAQRQEWFTLGTVKTRDENGNITAINPTMTEQQKPWYKKRLIDLGIPESKINDGTFEPSDLVGKEVFFGTKKNGSYININFVELRNEVATPVEGQTGAIAGPLL